VDAVSCSSYWLQQHLQVLPRAMHSKLSHAFRIGERIQKASSTARSLARSFLFGLDGISPPAPPRPNRAAYVSLHVRRALSSTHTRRTGPRGSRTPPSRLVCTPRGPPAHRTDYSCMPTLGCCLPFLRLLLTLSRSARAACGSQTRSAPLQQSFRC
jgi:hypothetical protein